MVEYEHDRDLLISKLPVMGGTRIQLRSMIIVLYKSGMSCDLL